MAEKFERIGHLLLLMKSLQTAQMLCTDCNAGLNNGQL